MAVLHPGAGRMSARYRHSLSAAQPDFVRDTVEQMLDARRLAKTFGLDGPSWL